MNSKHLFMQVSVIRTSALITKKERKNIIADFFSP